MLRMLTVSVVCVVLALPARLRAADSAVDVNESVLLLRNLLKDIPKETALADKYRLYLRATDVFGQVRGRLTPAKRALWVGNLRESFQSLPLPPAAVTSDGLRFVRVRKGRRVYYWGEPVRNHAFAIFLDARGIAPDVLGRWFFSPRIHLDHVQGRYVAAAPDEPVDGACYHAAAAFASWLSEREDVTFAIPQVDMLPPGRAAGLTVWAADLWRDDDTARRGLREMFGVRLRTLVVDSQPIGDLPEASYPGTRLRLVLSAVGGRRLYLRQLEAAP